jgi:hypothetical protein
VNQGHTLAKIETLLRAIEALRADLPGLVGADWPQFKAELDGYLKQLKANAEPSPILRARILALFGRHREAHRRLIQLIAHSNKWDEGLLYRMLGPLSHEPGPGIGDIITVFGGCLLLPEMQNGPDGS